MQTIEDIKEIAGEVLESEIYDMQDAFSNEEILSIVGEIVKEITGHNVVTLHLYKKDDKLTISTKAADTQNHIGHFKVNNNWKSWISFSDSESTGLSKSEYYIKDDTSEDWDEYDISTLLSMLNEAWYLCKN